MFFIFLFFSAVVVDPELEPIAVPCSVNDFCFVFSSSALVESVDDDNGRGMAHLGGKKLLVPNTEAQGSMVGSLFPASSPGAGAPQLYCFGKQHKEHRAPSLNQYRCRGLLGIHFSRISSCSRYTVTGATITLPSQVGAKFKLGVLFLHCRHVCIGAQSQTGSPGYCRAPLPFAQDPLQAWALPV